MICRPDGISVRVCFGLWRPTCFRHSRSGREARLPAQDPAVMSRRVRIAPITGPAAASHLVVEREGFEPPARHQCARSTAPPSPTGRFVSRSELSFRITWLAGLEPATSQQGRSTTELQPLTPPISPHLQKGLGLTDRPVCDANFQKFITSSFREMHRNNQGREDLGLIQAIMIFKNDFQS